MGVVGRGLSKLASLILFPRVLFGSVHDLDIGT